MGLNSDIYFCKPRKLDDNALEHTIVNFYDTELKRRKLCDDEYREDIFKTKAYQQRPCGTFMYADLSFHDLLQKDYADKFGAFIPLDRGWECPHCHTQYALAYPPLECTVCHTKSYLGEYVGAGYHRR